MSLQRRVAALAAISILMSVFYNNCSGRKDLMGTGTSLNSGNSNAASTSTTTGPGMGYTAPTTTTAGVTAVPELKGAIDAVHGDLIYGWACATAQSQAAQVLIKVDGVNSAQLATAVESEAAVSTACNTTFNKHRFVYRLSDSQYANLKGKNIQAFVINPSNLSQIAEISAGTNRKVGDLPFWYSKLPIGFVGTNRSAPSPTLTGSWDSFTEDSKGNLTFQGWACVVGDPESVALAILTAQNEFVGLAEAANPVGASEAATINTQCQVSYTLRRFTTVIDANKAAAFKFKVLKLVLAEPLVGGIYYGELNKASNFNSQVGATPSPTPTGTPTTTPTPSPSATPVATNTSCTALTRAQTCTVVEICPSGWQPGFTATRSLDLKFNIAANPGDAPVNISTANTQVLTPGYALTDIRNIQFTCTSLGSSSYWHPIDFNQSCTVSTAADPLHCGDANTGCQGGDCGGGGGI